MTVTVRIENTYEDGHESVVEVEVDAPDPDGDIEEWWEDEVWPHTGDGHTDDDGRSVDAGYEATITRADDEQLVGQSREWY